MRKNTYSDKKAGADDHNGKDAVNITHDLPPWFSQRCLTEGIFKDQQALSQYLNGCRQMIFSAATLYHDHIKYATTVLVSLLTATIAIFSFLIQNEVASGIVRIIELAGAVLMFTAAGIGSLSLYIIIGYPLLYIATLLYATEVHYVVGITGFGWFEDIIERLKKKSKNKKISKNRFIISRSFGLKYGHLWYCILIGVLIGLCLFAAFYLWSNAPFSNCY